MLAAFKKLRRADLHDMMLRVEEPGDAATELSSEESFVDVSRPRHTQTGEQGPMPWLTLSARWTHARRGRKRKRERGEGKDTRG